MTPPVPALSESLLAVTVDPDWEVGEGAGGEGGGDKDLHCPQLGPVPSSSDQES